MGGLKKNCVKGLMPNLLLRGEVGVSRGNVSRCQTCHYGGGGCQEEICQGADAKPVTTGGGGGGVCGPYEGICQESDVKSVITGRLKRNFSRG